MHCHDRHNSYRSFDYDCGGSYGSYGGPEFIILDFSPVTNIATITQIANAFSTGGVAAASNIAVITQ
jgi:hypothetical protein